MSRKLTDKQIVEEMMYSVKNSLGVNLPIPPMNTDGSFKTLNQMASERSEREGLLRWKQREEMMNSQDLEMSDISQTEWESSQKESSHQEEFVFVIPEELKLIFYFIVFILVIYGLFVNG